MKSVAPGKLRWGVTSAAGVVLVALGMSLIALRSGNRARTFLHPPRSHVSAEDRGRALAEFPQLVEASLTTSDGLILRGWFLPGDNGAVVLMVHGGGGNRLQMLPEARLLARHGYGALIYDSRASGESDGDLLTWGATEQRDVVAALDYLSKRPEVDPRRVAVLGFSIGGSTAALASARDLRVRALILYATWTSMEDEMKRHSGRFGPLSWGPALYVLHRGGVAVDEVRPIDHIADVHPRPLLMISGDLDDDTPPLVMQHLFDAAVEPKELWTASGVRHQGIAVAAPQEFERRVVPFLDRAFAHSPDGDPH